MDGTIIGQGSFSAFFGGANPNPGVASNQAASSVVVAIPSNADWMYVYNFSKAGANGLNTVYFNGTANAFAGVEYYWQRGMPVGEGIVKYKSNAASTLNEDVILTGGFTLFDPTISSVTSSVGPAVAVTAVTNATQPVVSTANTTGIFPGTIVRLSNTAQTDVNGIDMVVSAVTANTNFTLLFASNALANVPGAIGGAGFYRIVNFNSIFYPQRRIITNITRAVNAVVSTSIQHGLCAGQEIRFNIPAVSGMTQLNPTTANNYLAATILAVIDDYSFVINIDTTGFTAFTYPTIAQQPSQFPELTPIGEDTAEALISTQPQTPTIAGQQIFNTNTGILSDSTVNTAFLGMILGGGGNGQALTTPISGPAGTVHFTAGNVIDTQDLMFWVAGKSTYGGL